MSSILQVGYDVLVTTAPDPNAGTPGQADFNPTDFNSSDFQTTGVELDPADAELMTIVVQPQSETPNTVQALLNLNPKHLFVNNKYTNSGELSMILKNALRHIDFSIDDFGNLIVSAEDAKNYDIDDNGNLIYYTAR